MSIPIRFDIEAEQELEAAAIFYTSSVETGSAKRFSTQWTMQLEDCETLQDAFVLHPIFHRNLEYAG